jgi:hypothetical protein
LEPLIITLLQNCNNNHNAEIVREGDTTATGNPRTPLAAKRMTKRTLEMRLLCADGPGWPEGAIVCQRQTASDAEFRYVWNGGR